MIFSQFRKNIAISCWNHQNTYPANCIHSCVAWKLSLAKVKGFLLPPPLSIFLSLRTDKKEGRNKILAVSFLALWHHRNTEATWTFVILINLAAHAAKWCKQLKKWQQTHRYKERIGSKKGDGHEKEEGWRQSLRHDLKVIFISWLFCGNPQ